MKLLECKLDHVQTLASVLFTGATWAALQYPMADIRCITFGSPRVGNKAFKRAFHTLVGTSLRLVHGGDPIPVLPPAFVYASH